MIEMKRLRNKFNRPRRYLKHDAEYKESLLNPFNKREKKVSFALYKSVVLIPTIEEYVILGVFDEIWTSINEESSRRRKLINSVRKSPFYDASLNMKSNLVIFDDDLPI
jgi:hypothetical protein